MKNDIKLEIKSERKNLIMKKTAQLLCRSLNSEQNLDFWSSNESKDKSSKKVSVM